ncbi:MAG: CoA pyrophosphatase [Bacteroidales bacterium]|nr:CoA pyrophosphatase [Bacteroidales bacterium]
MNDLRIFSEKLQKILSNPLPGLSAQSLMIPPTRRKQIEAYDQISDVKLSAVLVLFYANGENLRFVLIKRAQYEGVHSGQIALPGGQYEPKDLDLKQTALRETGEEIGIDSEKVQVLGSLSPMYIPPSHFKVFPFVGIYPEKPFFHADGTETTQIIEVDVNDFLNPECQTEKKVLTRSGDRVPVPCFYLYDHIVWGATAMILSELLYLLRKIS